MKNLKTIFAFLITCTFMLVGCADFADTPGKSVWSEGLWIIPWVTGLGSVFFGYKTYIAATSGSVITNPDGTKTESDKNIPFYKIGWFYFFVFCFVSTILIIIDTLGNK